MRRIVMACAVVALGLLGASREAAAIERGQTPEGVAFVSGGVGVAERQQLADEKTRYNFWLRTAGKGSGTYLAAVRVRILDAGTRRPVLEHRLDGPWLYAALPPGQYLIEARYRDGPQAPEQLRSGSFSITAGASRQMVLYFDSADTVGQP